MGNTINELYSSVSASVAATRDALEERLQSVGKTTSLFNNRMMDNIEYIREKLKDTIEKEAKEEGRSLQKFCDKWDTKSRYW